MDMLSLAGVTSTDYTVTVTADAGIITFQQAQAAFTLTIKNPCVDPTYVQINKQVLPSGLEYSLWTY